MNSGTKSADEVCAGACGGVKELYISDGYTNEFITISEHDACFTDTEHMGGGSCDDNNLVCMCYTGTWADVCAAQKAKRNIFKRLFAEAKHKKEMKTKRNELYTELIAELNTLKKNL